MGQKGLKLVFMGTPVLAAAILEQVLNWKGGSVVGVYTQPDRPAGRGYALAASPVKKLAAARGLTLFQPQNFSSATVVDALRALRPDFLLVAAYGLLLPQRVLDIPAVMALNVHTSLLPRYRGAAPIARAVMNGDAESGVSIMKMDAGLDTGPLVLQQRVPIKADDTAASLHDALAALGGPLLTQAVEGLLDGSLVPVPQNGSQATYAPKLGKNDGRIDFSRPTAAVDAQVRGVTPKPGAFGTLLRPGKENLNLIIARGRPLELAPAAEPGAVLGLCGEHLALACADGVYGISLLRPAGRRNMDARAFANGYLAGQTKARMALPGRDGAE
jgi:methionyl-tRNA formyltransferase